MSAKKQRGGGYHAASLKVADHTLRGTRWLNCQDRCTRRHRHVESIDFSRSRPSSLRLLCVPCDNRRNQGWRYDEVEDPYADLHFLGHAYDRILDPQVRRSWNGRVEVSSSVLPGIVALLIHQFRRSLRPLVIALFPGQQRQLDKIRDWRQRLSNELSAIINEFGPQLYEDFDEVSAGCRNSGASVLISLAVENPRTFKLSPSVNR